MITSLKKDSGVPRGSSFQCIYSADLHEVADENVPVLQYADDFMFVAAGNERTANEFIQRAETNSVSRSTLRRQIR